MALPKPPSIVTPIPNNTFYSDPTWNLVAPQGPLIVGQGLEVVPEAGTVIAVPQAVGVNSIIAGSGISVDQPDGDVTITNTGVTNLQAGPNIQVSANSGTVVVEAVLPTFISSIVSTLPVRISGSTIKTISVDPASITASGIVQLYNDVDLDSEALAVTASVAKYLQDQISALVLSSSNLLFAGTIDANTGLLTAVTPEGTNEGFVVGSALPAPALTNTGYFVITTVSGIFTPPGATSPVSATKGDWFVSSGTTWDFLDVGFDSQAASTTQAGIVKLATDQETQGGITGTVAATPRGIQSKLSDSTSLTSSTTIASSTAVKEAYDLADGAIPKASLTAKGTILATDTPGQPFSVVPVQDGYYLQSDLASPGGVKWAPAGTVRQIDTGNGLDGGPIFDTGTIVLTNTAVTPGTYTYSTLTVDQQGRITFAEDGQAPITCQDFTAAGDILVGEGASSFSALPVGNDGEILVADSTCTQALKWAPACQGTVTSIVAGAGLCGGTITDSGTICLAGTNVIPATYSNATITVDELGRVLGASNGSTGVTSIAAGTGLNGGVITTSGTIELANTTVTAGTYTNATVTVDPQGRITSAVSGSGGGGGAPAYAQNALTVPIGFPPTQVDGTIMTVSIATSGNPVTVMASGSAQGCEGTGIGCVSIQRVGDGTNQSPQWIEATRFMDQTFAISHVEQPGPGVHTYALVYNSAVGVAECGMCFGASGACGPILSVFEIGGGGLVNAIECTTLAAKGDLITAASAATPTALPVGSNGLVLTANSSCALGLEWASPSAFRTNWVQSTEQLVRWSCDSTGGLMFGVGGGPPEASFGCASVTCNFACYRQVGPTRWQVFWQFSKVASGGTSDSGSSQYLFVIPSGAPQIDTSAPGQEIFTDCCAVTNNSADYSGFMFPSLDMMPVSYALKGTDVAVAMSSRPYDSCKVRFMAQRSGDGSVGWVGPNWFSVAGTNNMQWGFGIEYTSV